MNILSLITVPVNKYIFLEFKFELLFNTMKIKKLIKQAFESWSVVVIYLSSFARHPKKGFALSSRLLRKKRAKLTTHACRPRELNRVTRGGIARGNENEWPELLGRCENLSVLLSAVLKYNIVFFISFASQMLMDPYDCNKSGLSRWSIRFTEISNTDLR